MTKCKNKTAKIRRFRLSELKPAGYNPRTISDEAMAGLAKSLERFGCVEPLVVNVRGGRNTVVGGHQRLKVLEAQGVKSVVCVTVELSAKEEKALNVTLNNPAICGEFIEGLDEYLEEVRAGIGDEAFIELRLEQLRSEIAEDGDVFKFRPGKPNLKASGSLKGFTLTKKELQKFKHIKAIVLDFSGGRDSTLALAWAAQYFVERDIYAVYAETGVEFPGMGAHIEEVCEFFGVHCEIVKSPVEWWSWLRQEGQWPSLLFRECQTVFIHSQTALFRKTLAKETTLLIDGSRASQATRGSTKGIDTEVGRCPGYQAYLPCFNLTDKQAQNLLIATKAPLWEGYARGFVRSACWCCPGQCGLQAAALEDNYPGLAADIRRWERRIGPMRALEEKCFDDILRAGRHKQRRAAKADKKAERSG